MSLLCWENEWARGSQLPQSKLTEELVKQARIDYRKGQARIAQMRVDCSVAAFADKYGVSASTMEKALSGKTWAHV
jgi:hypothetical protein